MGQVPRNFKAEARYGLVGDGRLARHLARYFELEGISFDSWSRRGSTRSPEEALASCNVLLLAIRDGAIAEFAEIHPLLRERTLVHFSGALAVEGVHGFHPLMTFGNELYDLRTYRSIAFIGDRGDPGFRQIFPKLSNPAYEIDAEMRPLYHSLCVMSGNFTVLLWQKLFEDLSRKLGIPFEAALPYLRRIAANLETNPADALTGPIQRGDLATIEKNVTALDREGDPYAEIYRAFVRAEATKPARTGSEAKK